jgi:hypothetical protein
MAPRPTRRRSKRALAMWWRPGGRPRRPASGSMPDTTSRCDNLPALVAALPNLQEVSIGHAITADALDHGMAGAVRLYRAACADPVEAGQ